MRIFSKKCPEIDPSDNKTRSGVTLLISSIRGQAFINKLFLIINATLVNECVIKKPAIAR